MVASQPLLDTSSGVTGQVIDSNQIRSCRSADGTAYMLTRLAPGLSDSSDLHFSRPMDNGNLAGIVTNGAMGGNDFTLDGAPNRVSPNTDDAGQQQRRGRLLAALGRDRRVQGPDERVRRAVGPDRGRLREPRAQERHQRAARERSRTSTAPTAARRRRC